MPRPFEVVVEQHPGGGYRWQIEVRDETDLLKRLDYVVIATGRDPLGVSAQEAFWSAQAWARHHQELGYELRPNWWEIN